MTSKEMARLILMITKQEKKDEDFGFMVSHIIYKRTSKDSQSLAISRDMSERLVALGLTAPVPMEDVLLQKTSGKHLALGEEGSNDAAAHITARIIRINIECQRNDRISVLKC